MASSLVLVAIMVLSLAQLSVGSSRKLMELYIPPASEKLTYFQGSVLTGDIPLSILWYGKFTPVQKFIVSDFLTSLTGTPTAAAPSVGQWFSIIEQLYLSNAAGRASTRVLLDQQACDESYSLGKSLTLAQIEELSVRVGVGRKGGLFTFLDGRDGRGTEQRP
jgi:hypothetical protein